MYSMVKHVCLLAKDDKTHGTAVKSTVVVGLLSNSSRCLWGRKICVYAHKGSASRYAGNTLLIGRPAKVKHCPVQF